MRATGVDRSPVAFAALLADPVACEEADRDFDVLMRHRAERLDRRRAKAAALPRFVYFVTFGKNCPIKIGFTQNLKQRIAELQTGNPHKLQVLAAVPGTVEHEQALHRQFCRDRLEGEWFSRSVRLNDVVRVAQQTGALPSMVADEDGFDHDAHVRSWHLWTTYGIEVAA